MGGFVVGLLSRLRGLGGIKHAIISTVFNRDILWYSVTKALMLALEVVRPRWLGSWHGFRIGHRGIEMPDQRICVLSMLETVPDGNCPSSTALIPARRGHQVSIVGL